MININNSKEINIRDKKITVIGLGISGKAASILANHLGAIVFASDLNSNDEVNLNAMELIHDHHISTETGLHSQKIYDSDLWVLSPGISIDSKIVKIAYKKNIPIVSEIEFASWYTKSPIIGITGSNGKTTTTHILHKMFQTSEIKGVMAGNVGIPFSECVLNEILKPSKKLLYLLEVSSFQLEFISTLRPIIAIYTNISEDHLDRHISMQRYINMKMRLIKNFKKTSTVIYNEDDIILKSSFKNIPFRKIPFSIKTSNGSLCIKDGLIYHKGTKDILFDVQDLNLSGEHNLYNYLAAATCAKLYGLKNKHINTALKTFDGVPHRLEYISTIDGVEYINDSKATNINSVIVAINAYDRPLILILGGYNKGADFRLLLSHIKSNSVKTIITYGEAGGQIKTAIGDAVRSIKKVDLNSAVKTAHLIAQPGDIVLLSPGCASFDQFSNFEARGDFFKSIVRGLSSL